MEIPKGNERHWWVLASVSLGSFLVVVNTSIVNVALPTMARDFNIDLNIIQWVVLVYLLVITAVLPAVGRLSDLVGRKGVYCSGLIILMAGALVSAAASSFWMLLGGRVIMGLGAVMPIANGMALIAAVFPATERGRALGTISSVIAMGAMIGPVIGGILIAWGGWPWIFLGNIPLGLVAFFTAWRLLPKDGADLKLEPFDYAGAGLFIAGITALLLFISRVQDWGWINPATLLTALAALILLVLFGLVETRITYPLVDFKLFFILPFSTGIISAFISFMAMTAILILMPFYLQELLGYPPGKVGLLMLPYPLVMSLVAPVSGYLSDRISSTVLTTTGLLINAIGLGWLATLNPVHGIKVLLFNMSLLGLGMGLFQSPNSSSIMGSVPRHKLGVASGLSALSRNLGKVIGTAIMVGIFTVVKSSYLGAGTIEAGRQTAAFMAGWRAALMVAAGMAVLGAVISSLSRVIAQGTDKLIESDQ